MSSSLSPQEALFQQCSNDEKLALLATHLQATHPLFHDFLLSQLTLKATELPPTSAEGKAFTEPAEEALIKDLLVLLDMQMEPLSALEIAKRVNGKGATKASINSTLYAMWKRGLLERYIDAGQSKPKWATKKG